MIQQIIKNFSDQDLYSWSVCLYYLRYYGNLEIEYSFVDRNNTIYPDGFADKVMEQVEGMNGLSMTPEEISGLKSFTSNYFPEWFYTFLKGLSLDSSEVNFWQDKEGHLFGKIKGPAWRVVHWEQFLLATISELYHLLNGDFKKYNLLQESSYTKEKALDLLASGCVFCDMGTRRRFSKSHHHQVILDIIQMALESKDGLPGKFLGTSNLMLAMKYKELFPEMKCIGTMSHQIISVEAAINGPAEANRRVMEKWRELYNSYLGCYLFDCLGSKAFYDNFSKEFAKGFDSYRLDSGDNYREFDMLYNKIKSFGLEPNNIGCVFSNGLKVGYTEKGFVNEPSQIVKYVSGRMKTSFGLGTTLTCGMINSEIKPSNIVIKATGCGFIGKPWRQCVKLSSDTGKATGDPETIKAYKTILGL